MPSQPDPAKLGRLKPPPCGLEALTNHQDIEFTLDEPEYCIEVTPPEMQDTARHHATLQKRQATLPKPESVVMNGAFSPARRQPWAMGPPGNRV